MASDKPTAPTLTLSELRKEAAPSTDPFVLAIGGSKTITFKDPLDVPVTELDRVLGLALEAQKGTSSGLELVRELLSPHDYEAYLGLKLSARQHMVLVSRLGNHFEQATAEAGGPGEFDASLA